MRAHGQGGDPDFAATAGRVLDLYARQWQGRRQKDDEFVISADEKTSIQSRRRKHATQCCRPRTPMHVEHEYFRCGAWTYMWFQRTCSWTHPTR
ncbi:MAG: hypothetical protein NTW28_01750 [Candidatus Solibacter sp.]|nr:hypothetical protein [Candidatus Solibacter sp.]